MRPALFRRLKLLSQEQGKPISEIVDLGVSQIIAASDESRLERMYKGLFNLAGMGKRGIRDASSLIDETLYGENGAWKGRDA